MLIIPAIDIKDGCVVRFVQGKLDRKVYSLDPLKTARHWVRQGARLIHVVDLDGAISGRPKNLDMLKKIAQGLDVGIQFGGGIRNIETIKELLNWGIQRVVLGTKAIEDRSFLKKAFKTFGDKIIVSVDAKGDSVLIRGWQVHTKTTNVLDFISHLKEMGFKSLIYTDVLKDGTLKGPNIKNIKTLLKQTQMKVIASGGISTFDDVYRLKLLEKYGLLGIIIGKALYEGRFTLPQVLKIA